MIVGARDLSSAVAGVPAVLLIVGAALGAIVATSGRGGDGATGRILYLRSFDGGRKSVDLFSRLGAHLLNVAGIDLIAGPDLATALARPHELLDFLAGKAGRKYIHDWASFEAKRSRTDLRVDAEGRQRVAEYYCGNGIWKEVFRRLADDALAVLIDVRGVVRPAAGCAYELAELVRRVPLGRVLVVLDGNTRREVLETIVTEAWSRLPLDSPNLNDPNPRLAFFSYDDRKGSDVMRLYAHVCAMLEGSRVHAGASVNAWPIEGTGLT